MGTVAALWRYPVKSMLGEELTEAFVGPAGIAGDRGYALVDEADGIIASAKHPRKWGALLGFRAAFVDEPEPGGPPPPVSIALPDGSTVRSDEPGADAVISGALGRPVRLTAAAPDVRMFEEVWPDVEGLAPQQFIEQTMTGHDADGQLTSSIPLGMFAPVGTFFDLAVMHLITTSTLGQLAALAPGADFDVRRYRPNVLVGDEPAGFVENDWAGRTLVVGDGVRVAVTIPTMRCVMTTLPQAELAADHRTLRTIAGHNRLDIPGLGRWACAGVYADVAVPGIVRVGDHVRLDG